MKPLLNPPKSQLKRLKPPRKVRKLLLQVKPRRKKPKLL